MRSLTPVPDPAPASALTPARPFSTPVRLLKQCRLAQAHSRFPILSPVRLPGAFLGWPRGDPPQPAAERFPAPGELWRSRSDPRYKNRSFSGVSIGYGAPWEPDSGPDWRIHRWRNRPCCFLHFEVFWRQEGRGSTSLPALAPPPSAGAAACSPPTGSPCGQATTCTGPTTCASSGGTTGSLCGDAPPLREGAGDPRPPWTADPRATTRQGAPLARTHGTG
jgi:hypothetical protein